MKSKSLLFMIFAIAVVNLAFGDYKILQLNSPSIKVNGKNLHAGDVFKAPGTISWTNPRQAMKVLDMTDMKQQMIVAGQYEKSKVADVKTFLSQMKQMSTRDGATDNLITLRHRLSGEHYLADSLVFNTTYPTDDNHFFYVSYVDRNGDEINKLIPNDNGTFVLTRDIYTVDGVSGDPYDIDLTVFYLDDEEGTLTIVTDDMKIIAVPDMLE